MRLPRQMSCRRIKGCRHISKSPKDVVLPGYRWPAGKRGLNSQSGATGATNATDEKREEIASILASKTRLNTWEASSPRRSHGNILVIASSLLLFLLQFQTRDRPENSSLARLIAGIGEHLPSVEPIPIRAAIVLPWSCQPGMVQSKMNDQEKDTNLARKRRCCLSYSGISLCYYGHHKYLAVQLQGMVGPPVSTSQSCLLSARRCGISGNFEQ